MSFGEKLTDNWQKVVDTAMNNKAKILIDNCIQCPYHEVKPDPDPTDWFCDDDVKVVCQKFDNWKGKNITVACRPYRIETECSVPNWCPIIDSPKVP